MARILGTRLGLAAAALLALPLALEACDDDGGTGGGGGSPGPAEGFVSADPGPGRNGAPGLGGEDAGGGGSSGNPTVEEGDIYRSLGAGLIAVFNPYRGLLIADLSDPAAPAVIGRHPMAGSPVELYLVGHSAYLLLNSWTGYWGGRDDISTERYNGGLVLSFDLSDPTHPVPVAEVQVPGYIQTSRLYRDADGAALFVAASDWSQTGGGGVVEPGGGLTILRSFAVGPAGELALAQSRELGGWIAAVQGTPEGLVVASQDEGGGEGTDVTVLLVEDASGSFTESAPIRVAGWVGSKTNLDLRGGVLRVVSGAGWGGGDNANHLQTFDLADPAHPLPVDDELFGDEQQLYATIFLEDRAFFVTYRRTDPFHAFSIDAAGHAQEHAEFVVSGWNDFFKPALAATRLLGVGVDDAQGFALAVSLYDITDLDDPTPLVARETTGGSGWGYSEAQWDDRAFTVLDDAVEVAAPTGELETGLVLLPFQGWSDADGQYRSGVQLFTYSASTLTRRGELSSWAPVRRAILEAPELAASLSDVDLACWDLSDPDAPAALGSLDLAPNYVDFRVVGQHGARLKSSLDWYGWGQHESAPGSVLQLVSLTSDPDLGEAVGELALPPGSSLVRTDAGLVALGQDAVEHDGSWALRTTVTPLDLSDPTRPAAEGSLVTEELPGNYWGGWAEDCFDCGGWGYYGAPEIHAIGDVIVFVEWFSEHEVVGTERLCYQDPVNDGGTSCWDSGGGAGGEAPPPVQGGAPTGESCDYVTGERICRGEGDAKVCEGGFYRCVGVIGREWSCEPVEVATVEVTERCEDRPIERWWSRARLHPVDLRDRAAPALLPAIELPREQELRGVLVSGGALWVSTVRFDSLDLRGRPLVRWYAQRLELSAPDAPVLGEPINVPGRLLEVDGERLYTQDWAFTESYLESAVHLVSLEGGTVRLLATAAFPGEDVEQLALDGAGHLLVSHRLSWEELERRGLGWEDAQSRLAILDGQDLQRRSDLPVDSWASLVGARDGRALFNVPGGLLVVNVEDATAPFAQAFFPSAGWWTQRIERSGDDLYLASGRYGIQRFGLDETNLRQR